MDTWTRKSLVWTAFLVGLAVIAGVTPAKADPVITSPTEWTDDFTYDTSVIQYVAQHGGIWSCAPTIVARYDGVTHMELVPDARPALVHSYRAARTTPTAQEFRRLGVTGMSGGTETGRFGLFDQDNQGHASIELAMSQGVWKLTVVQGNVGGIFNTQVDRAAVGDWTIDWHTDRVVVAYNSQTVVDTTTTPIETTYGGGMGIPTAALHPYFYKSSNGTMMRVDSASWGAVPEPATMSLLSFGVLSLMRRRKR